MLDGAEALVAVFAASAPMDGATLIARIRYTRLSKSTIGAIHTIVLGFSPRGPSLHRPAMARFGRTTRGRVCFSIPYAALYIICAQASGYRAVMRCKQRTVAAHSGLRVYWMRTLSGLSGPVAQRIEQWFPKPCVGGSNPLGATLSTPLQLNRRSYYKRALLTSPDASILIRKLEWPNKSFRWSPRNI